jgi:hypothetical protein
MSKPDNYLSINTLYQSCGVPGPCGKKLECEGKMVRVKGYIDYSNVFDKKNYPQLPYEKFKIADKDGPSLEVWAISDNTSKIFTKIYENQLNPEKAIHIEGTIEGFDMPIQETCHRGIKLIINAGEDIFFR